MNKYSQSYRPHNSEVFGRRRKSGCRLPLVILGIIIVTIVGLLFWKTMSAAHADNVPAETQKEVETTTQDVQDLCGLNEVVCDGEVSATPKQEAWIDKLELCESSGNPKAINKKDTDGTPSYGAFQFKPGTFKMYLKRYEMKGNLMDREIQRDIVVTMMTDAKVKWASEFPNCVRKLGTPPKN